MKTHPSLFLRIIALSASITASLPLLHAADVILYTGTYSDTQTYNNGQIGTGNDNIVTFNSGANYTFDSLFVSLAWNHLILNSGATLNVGGNLSVDVSGVSLNGGTLITGGLLLHDGPNWEGSINDGKQSIIKGDSIINGSTIIANQSNANFISMAGGVGGANGWVGNNVWLGNDGATINSNGYNIGVTMAMGNYSGQTASLTKTGAGTLTLSNNNSYTGGTTVNGGVLEVQGSNSGNSYIRGTVTVTSGAELRYTGGDGTGFGFSNKLDTIHINGGLVNSQGNMAHVWGTTVNMNGGELRVNDGVSSPTGYRLEWNQSTVNTLAAANTAIISGRINLRGDGGYSSAVFNVADGSAATDLLVSAAITQSANVGITKNGAGTMVLSGANSYTGATTVNDGTLALTNPVLDDVAPVVIGANGKMALNFSGNDIVGSLEINGSGPLPAGTYSATTGGYESFFTGTGSLVVASTNGTWTSLSSGNWSTASNWAGDTIAAGYDATATFNAGTGVTVTVDSNRKIGTLAFDTSDYTLAGSGTISLDSSLTPVISVGNGRTATISANMAGSYGLEKTGGGRVVFTGIKSYTGTTTVTAGTLELAGAMYGNAQIHGSLNIQPGASVNLTDGDGTGLGWNNPVNSVSIDGGTINASGGSHLGFGSYGAMTLNNGSTVLGNWQWNGDGMLGFSSYGDSTNTINGNLNLRADAGASHTFYVDNGAADTDLLISANLSDQWPEIGWVPASGLAKYGAGKMVLSGTNTYDGNTVVNDGALNVTASGSLHFRPTTNGATNSVSGSATSSLSFLGTVDLDLTAANTTIGNSWNLFNLASFTGPAPVLNPAAVTTTTLGTFTLVSPGVWELPVTGAKWTFSAATGTLAYVNAATPYETWGAAYGLSAGSETGDLDGDGLTNFQEYAFGLIPNSGSSVNPITVQLDKATGNFSYNRRQQSLTGLTYSVWYSNNLATWTQDTGAVQGTPVLTGEVETVPVTISSSLLTNPKLFIQVRAN